jgi:hypothetical protein
MSRPSGDEERESATINAEQSARKRAVAAGRAAERLVALGLDRLEGLSLWALEQAAEVQPESDRLRTAERRLSRLRSLAAPLPRVVRRVVAGSTYFGSRWGTEAARSAKEIMGDTSEFLTSDRESQTD